MKLIVRSDDYGFTKGVTDGVCDALENGIITCTGLFANMPSAPYAVSKMPLYPHVSFGIDINVVSGPSVSPKSLIPTLVGDDGEFIRSTVKYADPRFVKGGPNDELWPYDECFKEACAQIEKFIELVGKKPEYVTTHSISGHAPSYVRAAHDAAAKYDIPFFRNLQKEFNFKLLLSPGVKPFTIENQLKTDVESYMLEKLEELKDTEYLELGGHCGFVDDELLKYSTYTIIRAKDHKMYTSEKIKKWIKDNNVELINIRDLLKK